MINGCAEFIPRDVLDEPFREPQGLHYLDTETQVFRSELENNDTRYDIISCHEPLDGDQVVSLLNAIAPSRGMFIKNIIGDWDILDSGNNSNIATELVALHTPLGQPWVEFTESQPALIGVLRDKAEEQYDYEDRDFKKSSKVRAFELEQEVVAAAKSSRELLVQVGERLEVSLESMVLHSVARALSRGKGRRSVSVTPQTEPEIWRRFESWSPERKQKLIQGLLRNLSPYAPEGTYTHDKAFSLVYDQVDIAGATYTYPRRLMKPGTSLVEAYESRETWVEGGGKFKFEAFWILDPEGKKRKNVVAPNSRERIIPIRRVQPHLSWIRKHDGSREFIIERSEDDGSGALVYHDGILGVMLSAYFSRDVVQSWPKRVTIGTRYQDMGAAQVPVLALMKQKDLIASSFFERTEELAGGIPS